MGILFVIVLKHHHLVILLLVQTTVDIRPFRIMTVDRVLMAVEVVVGVTGAVLSRTLGVTEVYSLVAEVVRVSEVLIAGVLSFRPSNRLEHLLVTVAKGTEQRAVTKVVMVRIVMQGNKFIDI